MSKILSQIISAAVGLWLATLYVPGVIIRAWPNSNFFGFSLTAEWQIVLMLGIALGLLNHFLRPVLKTLSLPLEVITLGLFTIVIDMALIWVLDAMFDELLVPIFLPLLYTALIVWGLNIIINFFSTKHNR